MREVILGFKAFTMPDQPPYRFFDLHAHHVFKTLYKHLKNQHSPWFVFNPDDARFDNALESQSCFTQVSKPDLNTNLLCLTWQAPETGIVGHLKLWIAPIFLKVYMDPLRLICMSLGEKILNADYQRILENELSNIHKPPRPDENVQAIKKIMILKNFSDYKINDQNTLYIFFNIEGGYLFYKDNNSDKKITKGYIREKYENFFMKDGKKILYLTATHLTPNIFVNHAYGCKIFKPDNFIPRGHGITSIGEDLLDVTYEKGILIDIKHMSLIARQEFYKWRCRNNYKDKPILASHMGCTGLSWNNKLTSSQKPEKGKGWVKIFHNKPKGHLDDTWFNPNSINLYDEDIVRVLESRGLIGISFDIRILGGGSMDSAETTEYEFLSKSEYKDWLGIKPSEKFEKDHFAYKYAYKNGETDWKFEDMMEQENEFHQTFPFISALLNFYNEKFELDAAFGEKLSVTTGMTQEKRNEIFLEDILRKRIDEHFQYFLNNLLHILKVGLDANLVDDDGITISPWKHICLGSDYDGLISAMHCCLNATEMNKFAELLETALPTAAAKIGITLPEPINNHLADLFFNNAYTLISKTLS